MVSPAAPIARSGAPALSPARVRPSARWRAAAQAPESPRERFAAGSFAQKALVFLLVGLFLLGFAITIEDKFTRVGAPDVGFIVDGGIVSPTRDDASDAGVRGGGRALAVNGIEVTHLDACTEQLRGLDWTLGAFNVLRLERPDGSVREIRLPVRPWTLHDALFTEGGSDLVGILIFAIGLTVFLLRPWEIESWALLSLASFAGGTMLTTFIPINGDQNPVASVYFRFLIGLTCYVPFHMALAYPAPHRLLVRGPGALRAIYAAGLIQGVLNIVAWREGFAGPFAYNRVISSTLLFASMLLFIVRCIEHAVRGRDRLVTLRARILLAGIVFGFSPIALTQFAQQVFGTLAIDPRFAHWAVGIFALAVARVTLSQELVNTRITVRRALIYATVVGILTVLAIALVSVRPYAVAALLLPLLYLWPRFDAWLDRKLYPQRARFPELLREIGNDFATCGTADEVLDALSQAPAVLCDARSSVAFLLPSAHDATEHVRTSDGVPIRGATPFADEPLVQLLRTTRKEIVRERIAIEPTYSNIKHECHAGFDRLRAELLLPIVEDGRVVGGLAIGPRTTGDVYQEAEIHALSTVAQQAAQALLRVEATERLRARELEFADLKRFFPPQVIDTVMARGGASELKSQRKIVTVLFADLRGFTSFSETHEPEEVTATLAEYHAAMGARIAEYGGTLEHFAGDGFIVFFNDPLDQPDHADRAVQMAIKMCADIRRLRESWLRKGFPIDAGLGIDTGYATVGFVGYEGRRDYGVIGNVTNLAARLSDAAAGGEILITARACAELRQEVPLESVGDLTLKGFAQPQPTFRVVQQG
ncbi:GAF domain-containing protein [Candidatus Binatia bacterium]|nr:GAF domain-containing protein [Candidatus Binatia bacterium]